MSTNQHVSSLRRIQKAHRTCSIWLGVGDRNIQSFRLVEYSKSTANVRIDIHRMHMYVTLNYTYMHDLYHDFTYSAKFYKIQFKMWGPANSTIHRNQCIMFAKFSMICSFVIIFHNKIIQKLQLCS